jgi:primase-polymerase (primpol)-like protein
MAKPLICDKCQGPLPIVGGGRIPKFCSTRCRVAAYRAAQRLPIELTHGRKWVRWTLIKRGDKFTKIPLALTGRYASSTNPSTWSTYREAKTSSLGEGLGIMLGRGLGCWDLDHCLDRDVLAPWALEVLKTIESPLWVERSISGTGLHVFVSSPEAPGKKIRDGECNIEFYSRARFIAMTGNRFSLT